MSAEVKVGAYFYPLTTYCPEREDRGNSVLKNLGLPGPFEAANELELAETAPPLFDGHDQPRTYCLRGEPNRTRWDDQHTADVMAQCALAQHYGLSYFVFDSYNGVRGGKEQRELATSVGRMDMLARYSRVGLMGFKYAKMEVLESPRTIIPIPAHGRREYGNSYNEPYRSYDLSSETARVIVGRSIPHWQNDRDYLYVRWRPYISFLMPAFAAHATDKTIQTKLTDFIHAFKEEAERHFWDPYVVGVMRTTGETDYTRWSQAGVDAVTEYCNLAYHDRAAEQPIQQYADCVVERRLGWNALRGRVPYVPSPAVGWDASPRGERGVSWDEVVGVHPYTPVVVGSTPRLFGESLTAAMQHTQQNVPEDERLVTIFAWNEIGEGATLLPRLREDGVADYSYLEAVRDATGQSGTVPREHLLVAKGRRMPRSEI